MAFYYDEYPGEDECPGCGASEDLPCECAKIYYNYNDDDHGPADSPEGDSESDHVWADLARSEHMIETLTPERRIEGVPDDVTLQAEKDGLI